MPNVRQLPPKINRHREYAALTAQTLTYDIDNKLGYDNLIVRLFADAEVGTATLDMKLQYYMETKATWYDITGASLVQVTANMTNPIDLAIGKGLTAVANRAVNFPFYSRIRIVLVAAGTTGFSVSLESEQN